MDHDKINRRALGGDGQVWSHGQFRGVASQHDAAGPGGVEKRGPGSESRCGRTKRHVWTRRGTGCRRRRQKPAQLAEWQERMLLSAEKEALGLYLTGHPFDAVRGDARYLADGRLGDITAEPAPQTSKGERNFAQARREATVAGLIVDVRKRGNRVSVVLDDDTARMEVSLFSEAFQEFRHLLVKDEIVIVTGGLRYDDFVGGWTINAKNVLHIDRVIESRAKSLVLSLAPNGRR